MATIEWNINGKEYANCNCAYGCPCQFNALPTHGNCEAAIGYQIDTGRFGDVKLDGLRAVALCKWPGQVHHGNGTMQLVIDERADAKQRDALVKIMSGQETKEMATMWWVYSAMCTTKLEPLFKPIELKVDIEARGRQLSGTTCPTYEELGLQLQAFQLLLHPFDKKLRAYGQQARVRINHADRLPRRLVFLQHYL